MEIINIEEHPELEDLYGYVNAIKNRLVDSSGLDYLKDVSLFLAQSGDVRLQSGKKIIVGLDYLQKAAAKTEDFVAMTISHELGHVVAKQKFDSFYVIKSKENEIFADSNAVILAIKARYNPNEGMYNTISRVEHNQDEHPSGVIRDRLMQGVIARSHLPVNLQSTVWKMVIPELATQHYFTDLLMEKPVVEKVGLLQANVEMIKSEESMNDFVRNFSEISSSLSEDDKIYFKGKMLNQWLKHNELFSLNSGLALFKDVDWEKIDVKDNEQLQKISDLEISAIAYDRRELDEEIRNVWQKAKNLMFVSDFDKIKIKDAEAKFNYLFAATIDREKLEYSKDNYVSDVKKRQEKAEKLIAWEALKNNLMKEFNVADYQKLINHPFDSGDERRIFHPLFLKKFEFQEVFGKKYDEVADIANLRVVTNLIMETQKIEQLTDEEIVRLPKYYKEQVMKNPRPAIFGEAFDGMNKIDDIRMQYLLNNGEKNVGIIARLRAVNGKENVQKLLDFSLCKDWGFLTLKYVNYLLANRGERSKLIILQDKIIGSLRDIRSIEQLDKSLEMIRSENRLFLPEKRQQVFAMYADSYVEQFGIDDGSSAYALNLRKNLHRIYGKINGADVLPFMKTMGEALQPKEETKAQIRKFVYENSELDNQISLEYLLNGGIKNSRDAISTAVFLASEYNEGRKKLVAAKPQSKYLQLALVQDNELELLHNDLNNIDKNRRAALFSVLLGGLKTDDDMSVLDALVVESLPNDVHREALGLYLSNYAKEQKPMVVASLLAFKETKEELSYKVLFDTLLKESGARGRRIFNQLNGADLLESDAQIWDANESIHSNAQILYCKIGEMGQKMSKSEVPELKTMAKLISKNVSNNQQYGAALRKSY